MATAHGVFQGMLWFCDGLLIHLPDWPVHCLLHGDENKDYICLGSDPTYLFRPAKLLEVKVGKPVELFDRYKQQQCRLAVKEDRNCLTFLESGDTFVLGASMIEQWKDKTWQPVVDLIKLGKQVPSFIPLAVEQAEVLYPLLLQSDDRYLSLTWFSTSLFEDCDDKSSESFKSESKSFDLLWRLFYKRLVSIPKDQQLTLANKMKLLMRGLLLIEQGKRKKRETKIPKEKLCVVCYEKPREVCLFPCRHYSYCATCANALQNCAVCRHPIASRLKLFT